jgi:uncharacterized protein YkwD
VNQIPEPCELAPSAPIELSRRGFLARLAALPAALGIATFITGTDDAEGKKNKKNKKRKKRKKRGGKKKGNGGGGYNPDGDERKFLDLINDYRRRNGAGNLSLHNSLGAAAESHSRDMARKNYFRHSNTKKIVERHGYKDWKAIGENIAAGQKTANEVFEDWRKSNDHDKNMRNKSFTEIGIGRAYKKSSKYGWYWTTTFGDR